MHYNPPPNWPPPPTPDWQPPDGWRPDPKWGPPPPGWRLWLNDDHPAAPTTALRTQPPNPQAYTRDPQRKLSGALTSKVWISIGTVVSALSLAVAGIVYFQDDSGSGTLSVAAVSMNEIIEIAAINAAASDTVNFPQKTAPVDISLKNTGDAPVTITEIRGEVVFYKALQECYAKGAGPGVVTASYSLVIPVTDGTSPEVTQRSISAPSDFVVGAGSVGRMEVTIGPEKQVAGRPTPNIMAVEITLISDFGHQLKIGTATTVTMYWNVESIIKDRTYYSPSTTAFGQARNLTECKRSNAAGIQRAIDMSTVHAPILDRLLPVYQQT